MGSGCVTNEEFQGIAAFSGIIFELELNGESLGKLMVSFFHLSEDTHVEFFQSVDGDGDSAKLCLYVSMIVRLVEVIIHTASLFVVFFATSHFGVERGIIGDRIVVGLMYEGKV